MAERVSTGCNPCGNGGNGGNSCIETKKVYDSCRDKECIENMRVYLTESGQALVDRAINVKCRKSEIIWIYSDVEPVQFNRGYYSVDLKFFFRITLDVFTGVGRPTQAEGIATFDKKVILFGSEGNARTFRSKYRFDEADIQLWQKTNLPEAHIEVVDPICLSAKFVDPCDKCCCCGETDISSIPESICRVFDDVFTDGNDIRKVYVTIGLFTIVRLERDVQLLIPVIDFCVPQHECIASTESNPCDLFEKLRFPVEEFFPPEKRNFDKLGDSRDARSCGCGD